MLYMSKRRQKNVKREKQKGLKRDNGNVYFPSHFPDFKRHFIYFFQLSLSP